MGFLLLSGGASASSTPAVVGPSYPVALTAYNAVPEQTDSNPLVTASGAYSNPEVVAARSQDLADELPFGTVIEIDGPSVPGKTCGYDIVAPIVGYRVIADVMNARFTNRVDILFSTESNYTLAGGKVKNAGLVLGICNGATVRVVGHVDITHPGKLPKTQAALAALITGKSTLALK